MRERSVGATLLMENGPARAEVLEALGLPADSRLEPAAGGASASAWRVRTGGESFVLRRSGSTRLTASRVAAMAAARDAGLPVPQLIGRASSSIGEVVLLSWLPGESLMSALVRAPEQAREWGRRMGELQRRLHEVHAPVQVLAVEEDADRPFGAGRTVSRVPAGDRLLHLDWHPLNLLVEERAGIITGIVDWDNARAGHPGLDLARTRAILTLEPELRSLPPTVRDRLTALLDGWADGYGAEARELPLGCERWALAVMIADLEPRHVARPEALDPIRRRLQELERLAG